jgi:hypothetical protein
LELKQFKAQFGVIELITYNKEHVSSCISGCKSYAKVRAVDIIVGTQTGCVQIEQANLYTNS